MIFLSYCWLLAGPKILNCMSGLARLKAQYRFFLIEKDSYIFCWLERRAGPINGRLNKWTAHCLSPRTNIKRPWPKSKCKNGLNYWAQPIKTTDLDWSYMASTSSFFPRWGHVGSATSDPTWPRLISNDHNFGQRFNDENFGQGRPWLKFQKRSRLFVLDGQLLTFQIWSKKVNKRKQWQINDQNGES